MENTQTKQYLMDNGTISICRHFTEKASPEDVIKKAVVRDSKEPDFLTKSQRNGKISMNLRQNAASV